MAGMSLGGGGGAGGGSSAVGAASVPSGIQFGGFRVIDVPEVVAACQKEHIPTPWIGKPNSYAPILGCAAGRGWLLMYSSDVDAIDLNGLHSLTFSMNGDTRKWSNLLVVGQPECVLPATRGDPNSPFLVEIADRKRLISAVPIDAAYNVRQCTLGNYYSGTLNSGSPWTWTLMIGDMWAKCLKLGTYPGLPISPDGAPENFVCNANYALEVLGAALEKLGLALAYNSVTDVFTIVVIGADDAIAESALKAYDGNRINDTTPKYPVRGNIPEKVRVCFPKLTSIPDLTGSGWDYPIDVGPITPITGVEPGTVAIIKDDLSAIYDNTSTLTNLSDLSTRAAAVAAQYYQRVTQSNLYRAFNGPKGNDGLLPGSLIKAGRWSDLGKGSTCEVYRGYGLVDPGSDSSGSGSMSGRFSDERSGAFDYAPAFSWMADESGRRRTNNIGALAQMMKYYLAACWGYSVTRTQGASTPSFIDSNQYFLGGLTIQKSGPALVIVNAVVDLGAAGAAPAGSVMLVGIAVNGSLAVSSYFPLQSGRIVLWAGVPGFGSAVTGNGSGSISVAKINFSVGDLIQGVVAAYGTIPAGAPGAATFMSLIA